MYNLFTNDPSSAGYRLEYMEVFNWGTFDKKIFRISPGGNNSLLTGANGSGKTTYVDALLTLLVPIKKYRFYNRSSGADKKNERTEESYVLGAYGEKQDENKLHSKTIYLRPDKKHVYSILVASFSNSDHQPVTLFQARWFFNGELKRTYGICLKPLTITDDFHPFDPKGEWKKVLKLRYSKIGTKERIEFFDSAKKYADRLVKLFGMKSEKALSLFNQTVGIKVLGNLDEFIRVNMLEPQEVEEEFANLKENYDTLLEAHRQIEKATEQSKLLRPVRDLAQQATETDKQLSHLDFLKETASVYFYNRLQSFLREEIDKENRHLDSLKQRIEVTQRRLTDEEDRRTNLKVSIETDETGRRIKEIEANLKEREREKRDRKKKHDRYNSLTDLIGLPGSPSEDLFLDSREKALELKKGTFEQITGVEEKQYQVRKSTDDDDLTFNELSKQVEQLRNQKNKITGRTAEIRLEILKYTKAAPDEIPFIGELIRVKETEKEWETAVERLLHNFALCLLVPEKYYGKVNRYVNENNLRGRIVYHRIKEDAFINTMLSRPSGLIIEKLDIKRTVYHDWLENRLLNHYDYICVDDVCDFHKYKRALTNQGLIKNKDRHQKDDRPEIIGRERFVLGWDNKDKIMVLARKAKELKQSIDEKRKQLNQFERQLSKLGKTRDNLVKFLEYDNYSEIDWQFVAAEIERLAAEKKRLEDAADHIKQLRQELQEVEAQIKELNLGRDGIIEEQTRRRDTLSRYETEKKQCREELANSPFPREEWTDRFQRFEEAYPQHLQGLSFHDFERVRAVLDKEQTGVSDKLKNQKLRIGERLHGKMLHFKNPDQDITDRFHDWRADTHKLSEDTRFVDEYISLLEKIEREDLPSYRKKFEDYLSTTMINKVAGIKEFLDEGEEVIAENIEALNRSLQKISFKTVPSTYIQLKFPSKQEPDLREFKKMLREAIPNAARLHGEDSDIYKKQVFRQIRKLIDKLDKEENWRRKVMDVRNWKAYYAEEYYRENNTAMKVYKDMGKLSGGEKAQLTYTILGSAIAYQFGIRHKGLDTDSFRFIAVDESFSNQDDERATYLMDLCRQLHLQLLVVTPSDKIHIVEPYISYVHYVQRRNNRESLLFDMPIKQYQEQKEQVTVGSAQRQWPPPTIANNNHEMNKMDGDAQ